MLTVEEGREVIAKLAEIEGEFQFAREVRAGAWDHRSDVINARDPDFKPRKVKPYRVTGTPQTSQ